jgi:hypothetical protein
MPNIRIRLLCKSPRHMKSDPDLGQASQLGSLTNEVRYSYHESSADLRGDAGHLLEL